ncbi:MAG: class F sortase [Acidimicrobiales bacterium]
MKQRRGSLRVWLLLHLAMGLALLGTATVLAMRGQPAEANPTATTAEAVNVGDVPGLNLGHGPDGLPLGEPAAAPPTNEVPPERIRLPSLGVDAPVVPVAVEPNGTLQIPPDPQSVGWWAEGAQPGAGRGTAVLAGHVNSARQGPGALANLNELRPGDTVVIVGGGRELKFSVEAVRQYPKHELPATEAFSQEVDGRLAIVSCGGQFDPTTRHYLDNIIAYAIPA